jgi:hypothetical protein
MILSIMMKGQAFYLFSTNMAGEACGIFSLA